MKLVKGLLGLAGLAIIAGIVVMYSGVIDVGATNKHNPITEFVLSTTMDNSVKHHAKGIKTPSLDDPKMVMGGFRHYREMCVECHLAPGIESSEISKGLLPNPPKLQEAVDEWTPAELFWVVKNGVKMTGMPAWGPTHNDQKLWEIVAFLEKLPHMTAEQYKEMDKMAGPGEGDEDHHHGDEGSRHQGDSDHGDETDHRR